MNAKRSRSYFSVLGVTTLLMSSSGCGSADIDDPVATQKQQAASAVVSLIPSSDVWISSVEGIGDTTNLYNDVDDGTSFGAADDNTSYVRAIDGVALARHAVGFSGAPAGRVTRVDVNYRAGNGGSTSTVKIYLIDDGTVIASSTPRPLGSYANLTESFTGLDIADANKIRVRVEFNNTSGSKSPRYTALWINATVETSPPLKAPVRGLLTRQGTPASGWDFIDHAVVHVLWKDLKPLQSGAYDWSSIDNQLTTLANKGVKGVRIRVMAGGSAPTWVKKLYGPAVSTNPADAIQKNCSTEGGIAVVNPQTPSAQCVPYFWRPLVLDAYQDLMRQLAARYDDNDMVREVVDSACMTVYAEPFYRAHADAESNKRLWNAGLNVTTDHDCHERAIDIHNTEFAKTRTSLAINSWDIIDITKPPSYRRIAWDPEAYDFATWARAVMGAKLELQNNGLGEVTGDRCNLSPADPSANYWCYLKSIEGPKGFQTETWDNLADSGKSSPQGLYAALDNALSMGANSVELPGGYTGASMATLGSYDSQLENTGCCGP